LQRTYSNIFIYDIDDSSKIERDYPNMEQLRSIGEYTTNLKFLKKRQRLANQLALNARTVKQLINAQEAGATTFIGTILRANDEDVRLVAQYFHSKSGTQC